MVRWRVERPCRRLEKIPTTAGEGWTHALADCVGGRTDHRGDREHLDLDVAAGYSLGVSEAAVGVAVLAVAGRNTRRTVVAVRGLTGDLVRGAEDPVSHRADCVAARTPPAGDLAGVSAARPRRRDAHGGRPVLVSRPLLQQIVLGEISDDRIRVLVSQAAGREPVDHLRLVAAVGVHQHPWLVIETVVASVAQGASTPVLSLILWKGRWLILAVALVDSAHAGRWPALGLAAAGPLGATTPHLRKRWEAALAGLGIAESSPTASARPLAR